MNLLTAQDLAAQLGVPTWQKGCGKPFTRARNHSGSSIAAWLSRPPVSGGDWACLGGCTLTTQSKD